jgi:DNA-binding CsgD family transcriptional regulator
LTILLGVLGAAVPLRVVATASAVAAAGMAVPHISDGSWTIGVAVAAGLLPPLFWLILEQVAGFMLRLHRSHESSLRHPPKRVWVWVDWRPAAHTAAARDSADPLEEEATAVGANTAAVPHGVELTARQLEVLLLCAEGLKHEEIGDCLQIGAVQVGRHLGRARQRAEVATNAELVAWAVGRGLIPRGKPKK